MKFASIGLAGGLALLAPLAHAQDASSKVQVYGIVDLGYAYEKTDGSEAVQGIDSGNVSGSRWGFRGSEDLGSGFKTVFLLEGGYDASTGQASQSSRLFGRWAYAGLQTPGGEVRFGLHRSFGYDWGAESASPFGSGWSNAAASFAYAYAAGDFGTNGGRLDNSVFYLSPTVAGGLQAGVGYSFAVSGAEAAGGGNNNRVLSAGVRYRSGPLNAVVTYERLDATDAVPTRKDSRNIETAVNYDFGPVRVYGGWGRIDDSNSGKFAGHDHVNGYTLGARVPAGSGAVLASWQKASESEADAYALGYLYALSKRTDLYAFYAHTSEHDFGTGADEATKQFSVGIRHKF